MWMPILTRIGLSVGKSWESRSIWASTAASTARSGELNDAEKESPPVLKVDPWLASIAVRMTSSCLARASLMTDGSSCHIRVEPSISVNRNVTAPVGNEVSDTDLKGIGH